MNMDKKKNIFKYERNIFFFLLSIYPWLLITGPFLSDSFAIIFSFYYIIKRINEKNYEDFKTIPFVIFCAFCLYISINSIFVAQNLVSLKSSLFFFRFGIFALAICYLLNQNKKRLNYFFFSLTLAMCLLFFDSIFQKIFGFNIIGIEKAHSIRISSFFGDELILGSFTFKIMPLILSFLYYLYHDKANKYSLIFIFISLIIILLSAEKASFAMIILFCLLFLISINFKKRIKIFLTLIFFSIIVLMLFLNKPIQDRLYHQFLSNSASGKYIYSAIHDSHFRTAYKMFKDKPIFGHGPKMYRFKCGENKYKINEFSCSTHPHNFVLQILSETGVVGFIFYLLFYLSLFKICFKSFYFDNLFKQKFLPNYILTSSLLVIFFPLATSGNIFNNWSSCLHFLTIGILIFFLKLNKNNTKVNV